MTTLRLLLLLIVCLCHKCATIPNEEEYNPSRDDDIDTSDKMSVYMDGGNPDMRSVEDIVQSRNEEEARRAMGNEMTDDVSTELLEEENVPPRVKRRRKRVVFNDPKRQWTHGIIPYQFDPALPQKYRQNYLDVVFPKIEYWTHFRFVPWNSSVPSLYNLSHSNYLIFLRSGSSCWSYIGNNISLKGQKISCCQYSRCLHEIGHAIGFYHEEANPQRDDYVRINYENIKPGSAKNFKKEPDSGRTGHFGYYDGSSVMSYDRKAFSKNGFDTITILDDDAFHLGDTRDWSGFYMFYEAQRLYRMQATKCPDFPLTCVNDGYVSYVDGQCRCRCTPGMDSRTGCATPVGADVWPEGVYSIIRSGPSCPPGFHHKTWSLTDMSTVEEPLYLCYKNYSQETGSGYTWIPGNYCIFRAENSSCPQDFQEEALHNVTQDGHSPQPATTGDNSSSVCCRQDGPSSTPVTLPIQSMFTLLTQRDVPCQQVKGLNTTEVHPPLLTQVGLKGCSYSQSEDVTVGLSSCGDMVNLGQYSNHVTVTSPQYPSDYAGERSCAWFFKGPPGSQVKLEFTEFELHKDGRACNGHVEIRNVLPGQPGVKYCGSGFYKTIISHTNSLQFILTSNNLTDNNTSAARRFNATVSLLTDKDLCYTNGGRDNSYHGNVNITRNFKSCLPWYKVTKCRHHMFSETDVDLEENYCRNPGHGTQPWCYTDADNCDREYCDVCKLRRCHDLFKDCQHLIETEEDFCNRDPEASRGCRQSCDLCDVTDTPNSVSSISCAYPDYDPPDGAVVSEVKDEYSVGENITYRCNDTGISEQTSRQIVCTSDGEWLNVTNACQVSSISCAYPDYHPPDGVVVSEVKDEYSVGENITYRCNDTGISEPTSRQIVCTSDGEWLNVTNACQVSSISCAYPDYHPPDGVVVSEVKDKYSVGEKITYRCNDTGISEPTSRQIVCTSEGEWSNIINVCQVSSISCAYPDYHPPDGVVVSEVKDEYSVGEKITYRCNDTGISEPTSRQIVCTSDGEWLNVTNACQVSSISCAYPDYHPPDGVVVSEVKDEYSVGEKLTYRCNDTGISEPTSRQIVCTSEGDWSNITNVCQVSSISCAYPDYHPPDGVVVSEVKDEYSVGEKLTYRCNDTGISEPTSRQIVCTSEGDWSNITNVCQVSSISCAYPDYHPPDGVVVSEVKDEYSVGEKLTYRCNDTGISEPTSRQIVCTSDGEWSNITNVCQVSSISCAYPDYHPPGGVVVSEVKDKYAVGEKITYRCNDTGISEPTSRQIVCTSEGEWSNITNVCQGGGLCVDGRRDCDKLLQQTPQMCIEYRTFAAVKCANTCGICSSTNRLALQDGCLTAEQPVNASIVNYGPWVQGDVVRHKCDVGFILQTGNLYRACQGNGHLTGSVPVCIAQNEAVTELFHVPLRRRQQTGAKNQVYTLSSEKYLINRTGEIRAWKFYSLHSGKVQFQVWRQIPKSKWFKLIGANREQETRSDRLSTINVDATERINVIPGDFIAIYFPPNKPGGVTFDPCNGYHNPEGLSPWVPIKKTSRWRTGLLYAMRKQTSCKLFSVSAIIGPVSNVTNSVEPGSISFNRGSKRRGGG